MLLQKPWNEKFLPWSEARWHQGEDISWYGYRHNSGWPEGLPHWDYDFNTPPTYLEICPNSAEGDIHKPWISPDAESQLWGSRSSINLQLSRGIYQVSKIRPEHVGLNFGCPYEFREPWFQGIGKIPVFNTKLDTIINDATVNDYRLAQTYYPNFLNIYAYQQLIYDGGQLIFDFERSATWPRQMNKEITGASVVQSITDEYGNKVVFDRVPDYGWETDYKVPRKPGNIKDQDPTFGSLPEYNPNNPPFPQSWRLPHKRLRTVQLMSADAQIDWTIAFVYEHPESDRIAVHDTPPSQASINPYINEWKSLYSHLPQSDWDFGRLPELNDETTLLTVQVYKNSVPINGARFQDDYSVWSSSVGDPNAISTRVNKGIEYVGDYNSDGCPGICGIDDDGDGLIDEGGSAFMNDDNEDGIIDNPATGFGITPLINGRATDGPGDTTTSMEGTSMEGRCSGECNVDEDGDGFKDEDSNQQARDNGSGYYYQDDYFAHYDDDEDGIYDEDSADDPLLVNLRAIAGECASGKHPYVPATSLVVDPNYAVMPGSVRTDDCQPIIDASGDPWVYQVQYVYARSNPYWLLSARNTSKDPTSEFYGRIRYLKQPQYYYFPPFDPDINHDGDTEDIIYIDGTTTILESDLITSSNPEFPGMVVDSIHSFDEIDVPNVHPDCLPDPEFLGPQGTCASPSCPTFFEPTSPGDIHLIKRIVRSRPYDDDPTNIIEKTWLYRYNDFGFLKAVFSPETIEMIIDADVNDAIKEVDDILKYSDTYIVDGIPLIMYAEQWYTYYNPYIDPEDAFGDPNLGIPSCYDNPPFVGICDEFDEYSPLQRLPMNGCDGERLWSSGYESELYADSDCSDFMRQDCGWCFARETCAPEKNCGELRCGCYDGTSLDENQLSQMGIPGAQPRFRKYMIKTARVRENDGATHLYRFDYLGASSGVYDYTSQLASYADPHNITIVDEMVEQDEMEFSPSAGERDRNEFYIYEDEFRVGLDPAETRPGTFSGKPYMDADTHFMYLPSKVKTRRVVVMNYYGIAISDRLILTPGFQGDQTSLVDNQQYELMNTRGQRKHVYDQSWVAGLREVGSDYIRYAGRVGVELFGGDGGWYSVLKGIAWGSGGGNVYDQQCKTPEVLSDVPVQRVRADQINVLSATDFFERCPSGLCDPNDPNTTVKDMPSVDAIYYRKQETPLLFTNLASACGDQDTNCVMDPAGTIGEGQCNGDNIDNMDLHNQDPVDVNISTDSSENDGVSLIKYFYTFRSTEQKAVRWKWQWQESVPSSFGGTGNVALQVWYYDQNGRVVIAGRGSGTFPQGVSLPVPTKPYVFTYFGYDNYGRQNIIVEDIDPAQGTIAGKTVLGIIGELNPEDINHTYESIVTHIEYNDIGVLKSRTSGKTSNIYSVSPSNLIWTDSVRTDYKILSNKTITYKDSNDNTQEAWRDDHTYQIVYQNVASDGKVFGNTSVTVLDKGGKFLEERLIAWNSARKDSTDSTKSMNDKIDKFGWGIKLTDYDYDGAIEENWSQEVNLPMDLFSNSSCRDGSDTTTCFNGSEPVLFDFIDPPYPGSGNWPPYPTDQIVTLARSLKQYNQHSTLKPTEEIVFNRFDISPSDSNYVKQKVIRHYKYDLEDRIARQEEPDRTISRFLFDPKRRPIKIYKGSNDNCLDWHPSSNMTGTDDMILMQHYLYNDGDRYCEHSKTTGLDTCTTISNNTNFPRNAGKLVRTRQYTGRADFCGTGGAYAPLTSSRDQRFIYDWRGRPVIVIEEAIGYETTTGPSTFEDPKHISATTTIFDNIDRPLLVATWGSSYTPALATIEDWYDVAVDQAVMNSVDQTAIDILIEGPLTLARTIYDERGRPFEQRTYDVSDTTGATYLYTKTYRDDLDRVVAEYRQNGLTVNTYDSLGRVSETSHWSEQDPIVPYIGAGTELTRTVTTYDAFGNVETQTHYDKIDIEIVEAIEPEPTTSNAIITYTYSWYNNAKRLMATAYFGTNSQYGLFTNGDKPLDHNPDQPPIYGSMGYKLWRVKNGPPEYLNVTANNNALITRYGYDAVGRRIWTQDGKGYVTRTWYDLLGRTLLVAENWKDNENLDYDENGSEKPINNQSGDIRYTAYHYTRGGLNDMVVAIIPAPPNSFNENIIPSDITWGDNDPSDDYAASDVTVNITGAKVQATRYVYGGNGNIVEEIVVPGTAFGTPVSSFPNLVSEIQYPDSNTGLPSTDSTDTVTFKYTMGGQIAQRTDQRRVTLNYEYGASSISPGGEMLTAVRADLTNVVVTTPPQNVDSTINAMEFGYNESRQLNLATSKNGSSIKNQVAYQYGSFQNLTKETLSATGLANPGSSTAARATSYLWCTNAGAAGENRNRLERISYPSQSFYYTYGDDLACDGFSTGGIINRMSGMYNLVHYDTTGSGRILKKTLGNNYLTSNFQVPPELTPGETPVPLTGYDQFGRLTNLTYDHSAEGIIQRFQYGYDNNGNRKFERRTHIKILSGIPSIIYDDNRSYIYEYDKFNRLKHAERGELNPTNSTLIIPYTAANPPVEKGYTWELDLLGNWSNGTDLPDDTDTIKDSRISYTPRDTNIGFGGSDIISNTVHHDVNSKNEITNTSYTYDLAGNMTKKGSKDYIFDAWNRLVEVVNNVTTATIVNYYYDALGRRIRKYIPGMVSPGQLVYFDGSRPVTYYKSETETYYTCPPSCDPGGPGGGGGGGAFKEIYDPSDPEQNEKLQSKNLDEVFDALGPKIQTQMNHIACACPEVENTRTVHKIERAIIYGTQYIDEQAVQFNYSPSSTFYVLTDANYNVVGLADSGVNLNVGWVRQYYFDPYGDLYKAEKKVCDDYPACDSWQVVSVNTSDPSSSNLYNHNFRNGMVSIPKSLSAWKLTNLDREIDYSERWRVNRLT